MAYLGKIIAKKLAGVIVLILLIFGGLWWFRKQLFGGTISTEYSFVIKRFSERSQLVVADADVVTPAKKEFDADLVKDWPEWTNFFSEILVSRKVTMEIPVKTEFKLNLEEIDKNDIVITNNILTFKRPLTVLVDSQQEGEHKIISSSNGLLDTAVDVVTGSKEAMKFLTEKSQEAVSATSDKVMNDSERKEKVATFSENALENLINLNSEQKIDVQITVDDLLFQNADTKK